MKKVKTIWTVLTLLSFMAPMSYATDARQELAQHLQDVSVTLKVKSSSYGGESQGSGVIITRDLKPTTDSTDTVKVNFIWTAGHVVDSLRETREIIRDGKKVTLIEFKDADVVKELVEDGRRVGELKMSAQVIRYSDADNGQDLALLMLRKKNFVDASAKFHLEDPSIIPLGTKLYHVGSLQGQLGANSMTTGIMSQIGRVLDLGNAGGKVFDQTTVTAFPGCIQKNGVIYTSKGIKQIKDIKKGDIVITYDDRITMADGTWSNNIQQGNQVLSFQTITGQREKQTGNHNIRPVTRGKVKRVWSTGIKPIFKVKTRNKSIKATANHPFVKATPVKSINGKVYWIAQWCRLDELNKGDIVGVMKQHIPFRKSENLNFTKIFGNKENHLPAMRLLGFYIGDGYSRFEGNSGEVALYTFDKDDSNYYTNIVNKLFPKVKVKYNKSQDFIRFRSGKVVKLFKELGITGTAKTKRLPKWLFTCPPEFQKEFLEGIVDADGHRNNSEYQIELANQELIEDIWMLANNLGMGTSNISTRSRTANLSGREIPSTSWTVSIYPNPVKQSAQMGGTTDFLPQDLKWERIANIIPMGKEETFDMEIDTYHNFFANGFLVHNSSGGGVFFTEENDHHAGEYCGMLVRGAGETFNLIVPIRRMKKWAKTVKVEWALDPNIAPPALDELLKQHVDDTNVEFTPLSDKDKENKRLGLHFLLSEEQPAPERMGRPGE